MIKISKRTVEALAPTDAPYFQWDEDLKGFGVRVLPSKQRTYVVQYRSGGRTRRVKIGRRGAVTAEEARAKAKELLGAVAKGTNPAEDISVHRQAPTVATACEPAPVSAENRPRQKPDVLCSRGWRVVPNL